MILSSIASILRLFSAFVSTFNEERLRTSVQGVVGIDVEELILVSRETANLQTGVIQRYSRGHAWSFDCGHCLLIHEEK